MKRLMVLLATPFSMPALKYCAPFAIAALQVVPVLAAPKTVVQKRTLKQLIEYVGRVGKVDTVKDPLSSNLGFNGPVSGPSISFDETKTKDHKGHDLTIIRNGKTISALIMSSTGVNDNFVDGVSFRASATGKLIAALSARGKDGDVVQTKLDVSSKETQTLFKQELEFLFGESVELEPDK